MTNAGYRPRFGFDIRVRPTKEDKKRTVRRAPETRVCEAPGCDRPATAQVAKSPREPRERLWLCSEHAAAHNKSWNYFEGLSPEEAERERVKSMYGDRPTWSMGKNGRAHAASKARRPGDFDDSYGVFGDGQSGNGKPAETKRRLPRLQAKALETMELSPDAKPAEIRSRYAELLRRYHPDANGGDRSAERQLQEVVKAHQILKKAGFC